MQSSTPIDDWPTGIYWGYARIENHQRSSSNDRNDTNSIHANDSDSDTNTNGEFYNAAISIGYNPTYGNTTKTVEPHFIAPRHDPRRYASTTGETLLPNFYDQTCRLSVVGYLRPELPFTGIEALIVTKKADILTAEHYWCSAITNDPIALQQQAWVQSDAPER